MSIANDAVNSTGVVTVAPDATLADPNVISVARGNSTIVTVDALLPISVINSVTQLTVNAGDGADAFSVSGSGGPAAIALNAGNDADSFTIGGAGGAGTLTLNAGSENTGTVFVERISRDRIVHDDTARNRRRQGHAVIRRNNDARDGRQFAESGRPRRR